MDWRGVNISRHREEHFYSYSTNPEELVESHIRFELIVLVDILEGNGIIRSRLISSSYYGNSLFPRIRTFLCHHSEYLGVSFTNPSHSGTLLAFSKLRGPSPLASAKSAPFSFENPLFENHRCIFFFNYYKTLLLVHS